ncbi:MAG: FAD-binding oxidoreductase [Deltaproteobacteria bacterium]|nr:FAD-binding oxidoreductase [Deltaproteobacteria bacterium]MDH3382571.1 FAD-binding oxidoreductase [Deltaproteobacteria bacterium]
MALRSRKEDILALPEAYRVFHDRISPPIPPSRIFCDPFRTLAFGTDASFYRLVPKIVVKVNTPEEVAHLLRTAGPLHIPVTFRAAGTSLSGQAVTDSVLVVLAGGWRNCVIHGNGEKISLGPGIIGAEANARLAPYRRKIGPDPASINHCMIGGIAANNASGMCCGTAQNSYRTVESMKIIFHEGTVLDTADPDSRRSFLASHAEMIRAIEEIRDEITGDNALRQRIRDKFRIKNTTGYSINAFVDFSDPVDILLHLMVGSEGTLGFLAEVTYRTVEEHAHNASALILFPDIGNACRATIKLKTGPVSAVELMDRASLRSVEEKEGMPAYLKTLGDSATGLLVETRAGDADSLARQVKEALGLLSDIPTIFPAAFTDQKAECEKLWNVRKGLFPAVGAARQIGTTVVIEDVVFPIETLADATLELEGLMKKHGYDEGIIFGHALEGNLHFVFTQDFSDPGEVARYQRLMEDVCDMVVRKYDGSLKGEHGTGRNMAPFVEMEWGEKAYALMKRIKRVFDPKRLLNPGVILNDNPQVYLEDLKPLPEVHEIIDKCTECGFCEVVCPSKDLTTTPRQRIVIQREISRLRAVRSDGQARARFEDDYRYLGEQTCATDGLCATTCPVSINTGEHTKELRSLQNGRFRRSAARWAAGHYTTVTAGVRGGLAALGAARTMLGDRALGSVGRGARALSGDRLPLWNTCMPNAAPVKMFRRTSNGSARKVVYFPSCIVRTMGPSPRDPDQRALFEAICSLLEKGGYEILHPPGMAGLCCGMPFGSKGFIEEAERKRRELEAALLACSRDGEYPVLFDTSPCLYTVKQNPDPRLRIYEPVEFIHSFLLDALEFTKIPETIAVHVPCSSVKMGLREKFLAVAGACAETVVVPDRVGCCGVAGDRIFFFPDLSESALSALRDGLPAGCRSGYSSSRACEIGLSLHSGLPYQSIAYLVDRCAARKA